VKSPWGLEVPASAYFTSKPAVLVDLVAIPLVIAAEMAILFLVDSLIIGSDVALLIFAGIILGAALFAFETNLLATQSPHDQQISDSGHPAPS
jgi:hypothetical protein